MDLTVATRILSGFDVAHRIDGGISGAIVEATPEWAEVHAERLPEVARFLHDDPEMDFRYLTAVTGVHRLDHFEVVYHLQSIARNQLGIVKAKSWNVEEPQVPSVVAIWRGALLQEREAFDLLGIHFEGHPDLRRMFLWEGFPGHPLRKDWLGMPGDRMSGLQGFPGEPGYDNQGRG